MQLTLSRGIGTAILAGALVTGLAATPAHANLGDGPAAVLTNTNDQLAAELTPQDPNVTCDAKAGGRDIVQRTHYVVGEVYGQDFGTVEGECLSLDTARPYSCKLTVTIQYFDGVSWRNTPFTGTRDAAAVRGQCAPVPPVAMGVYPGGSPYLNKYHRARGVLTVSIAGVLPRVSYSPVWFMFP